MSRSSQTALVTVTFDPITPIAPLTTTSKRLADDVELYLQRVRLGDLTVSVAEHADEGQVRLAGQLVTTFSFAPLGGAR